MKIAIVHYHLRRGGVTRVIETALEGLSRTNGNIEVVVLSGEPPSEGSSLEDVTRVVPELGYRNVLENPQDVDVLARAMESAATDALGGSPDLWHIHNHSLGKNVAMPGVLARLLADGSRLLLQIHDFAEDGRPSNYLRQRSAAPPDQVDWYPDAPQVHYALLNQRDSGFLTTAGLSDDRRHLLPNAVSAPPLDAAAPPSFVPPGHRFLLYPTRGIRRKNLGEMILLAALAEEKTAFASTLAPENPEWKAIHDRWETFARRHQLPVAMGVGADPSVSFGGLIASADVLLTTSVAEGFGLAFLEPWLAGKAVRGRDLPEITSDFARQGVQLEGLYDRLEVPLEWIDGARFESQLQESLDQAFTAYDRALPEAAVERASTAAIRDHLIDFGRLDEPLQEQALEALLSQPGRRNAVSVPNLSPVSSDSTASNQEAILSAYGMDAYGDRLVEIYGSILGATPAAPSSLNADALLDAFLAPERFFLLRS